MAGRTARKRNNISKLMSRLLLQLPRRSPLQVQTLLYRSVVAAPLVLLNSQCPTRWGGWGPRLALVWGPRVVNPALSIICAAASTKQSVPSADAPKARVIIFQMQRSCQHSRTGNSEQPIAGPGLEVSFSD